METGTVATMPNDSSPLLPQPEGRAPISTRKLVFRPLNLCVSLVEVALGYNLFHSAIKKNIQDADTLNKVIASAQPIIATLFKDKLSFDYCRLENSAKISYRQGLKVVLGNALVTAAAFSAGILIAYLIDKNN